MLLPTLTIQNKQTKYQDPRNYAALDYSAKLEEVPSHVLIKYANFFCSGSLISSRIVLTAATCFHRHKHEKVLVKLGTDTLPGYGQILSVIRMKKHEFYGSISEINNDIAMLVLEDNVYYSDKVKKIPIANSHQGLIVGPESRIVVYGFGSQISPMQCLVYDVLVYGYKKRVTLWISVPALTRNTAFRTLQSLPVKYGGRLIRSEMTVLDNLVCKKNFGGLMTSSNFCAKYVADNPLSDNGGAATVNGVMVGLVSYGINNDLPPFIAILTNVTYFFRWIGMNTVRHMKYYCKDINSSEIDKYEDADSVNYSS